MNINGSVALATSANLLAWCGGGIRNGGLRRDSRII